MTMDVFSKNLVAGYMQRMERSWLVQRKRKMEHGTVSIGLELVMQLFATQVLGMMAKHGCYI